MTPIVNGHYIHVKLGREDKVSFRTQFYWTRMTDLLRAPALLLHLYLPEVPPSERLRPPRATDISRRSNHERFAACVGLWEGAQITEGRACEILGIDRLTWRTLAHDWLQSWLKKFAQEKRDERAKDPEWQALVARHEAMKAGGEL